VSVALSLVPLEILAEAAVRTARVGLGSAVLGVWGRSAAQLAPAQIDFALDALR
jgi:hypothetical protein